jgi:hypothetical protein
MGTAPAGEICVGFGNLLVVIPAKAGIQERQGPERPPPDPRFRGGDR